MNKIFFITFVTISALLSLDSYAQGGKEHKHFDREAFQTKRNAFITAEVGLTPEEAASFIPLCNELRQKMFDAGRECRKFSKEMRSKENPTEADYTQVVDKCLEVKMKEAQLEKEYYEKFRKILSAEKLYKYHNAEFKFARSYIRGSGERKEGNRKK